MIGNTRTIRPGRMYKLVKFQGWYRENLTWNTVRQWLLTERPPPSNLSPVSHQSFLRRPTAREHRDAQWRAGPASAAIHLSVIQCSSCSRANSPRRVHIKLAGVGGGTALWWEGAAIGQSRAGGAHVSVRGLRICRRPRTRTRTETHSPGDTWRSRTGHLGDLLHTCMPAARPLSSC
jgi:hypothetical protein